MGFGGAPPWAVSVPDLDVGAWAWVKTRVNRPALSRRAGGRLSRQERKRLWAWLTRCVYFSLAGQLDLSERKDRFHLNKNTYPGIIFPDKADASRRTLEVEAGSSRVLDRAPHGTACISPRGRRGSQEHRTGKAWKMAPSAARVAGIASTACTRVSTRPIFFLGRVEPWVGFKDI